jgi:DNA gyrase subunit B
MRAADDAAGSSCMPATTCSTSCARRARSSTQIESFNTRYNRSIIEQAAIVGGSIPMRWPIRRAPPKSPQRIANRLDRVSDEVERGWGGEPDGQGGLVFTRTIRGVTERHEFDAQSSWRRPMPARSAR